MSPRPKRRRILDEPPASAGFLPLGGEYDVATAVILLFEEYAALKLADYELLNQEEASTRLQVSRPTFTRIYSEARRKVATAFAENRPIVIQGGNVEFHVNWYQCNACGCVFKPGHGQVELKNCPVCESSDIVPVQQAESGDKMYDSHRKGREKKRTFDNEKCICPGCDYEVEHQPGQPCNTLLCTNCNIRLVRKGSPRHLYILEKRKTKDNE